MKVQRIQKKQNRFNTSLDIGSQIIFDFDQDPQLDENLIKEFRNKFSFKNRLLDRLKS